MTKAPTPAIKAKMGEDITKQSRVVTDPQADKIEALKRRIEALEQAVNGRVSE